MATNRSVLINALTQFFGKGITMITSLIIVKIITGFGAGFYGDYVTTYEFLAFFGIIADAGLFAIAVKEISQADSKQNTKHSPEFILGNVLSIRLVLIFLVCGLAILTTQLVPVYSEQIKLGIWLTATSMGLTIIAGTLSSVLQARMKIQYFTLGLVLGKIFLALATFLIAQGTVPQLFENPFFDFLFAGVLSNILFLIVVYYFAAKEVTIRLRFDLHYWKQTLRVSLPYGLALILQTLYLRLDIILISIILGAAATGVYGVSGRIMESFLVLGVFFGQSILPKIAKEATSCDKTSAQTLLWGIEKLIIISLPVIWGMWIFAQDIILILSSSEFLSHDGFIGADTALKVLLPTIFFAYLNQLFTFTLVSKNRQNYLLFVNATALILNGVLNVILLPKYGILAAAATTVFCEVIVFVLLFKEIQKQFHILKRDSERCQIRTKNLLTILLLNGALFSLVYFTPLRDELLLAAGICGFVYLGILYKLRKRFI